MMRCSPGQQGDSVVAVEDGQNDDRQVIVDATVLLDAPFSRITFNLTIQRRAGRVLN